MKKLTIVHTESHTQWGGQELRVLTECTWMQARGHRVFLAAPRHARIYPKARAAGIGVYPYAFSRLSAAMDLLRLRWLLKQLAPDVLNTHGNMDSKVALVAARGLGIGCVIRSRHHSHPVSPSWYNRRLYRDFSHYVLTTGSCISRQIVADLGVCADKVVTLGSGIRPPANLPQKSAARARLCAELGLGETARFIGCVAMLRDWKGHDVLLDAFVRIHDRLERYHLVLVGDGDERENLQRRVRRAGLAQRVHFTGFRKNPWPYFRALDCNVLASTKNEGIPQVLLQAMYARCAVIGTDVGGIPDIVRPAETGLLVAPENSGQLAEALIATLNDREKTRQRVEKAYAFVNARYTLDRMGERLLGLYERALATADPR